MELHVPLMLYWDLDEDISPDVVDAVCDDIGSLGVLRVDLRGGQAGVAAVRRIAANLAGMPAAVYITAPAADAGAFLDLLDSHRIRGCHAEINGAADFDAVPAGVTGISFAITAENFRDLPVVASRCAGGSIPTLVLPMERLRRGEPGLWLARREREELRSLLATEPRPQSLKITAHDPFLWQLIFPSLPHPENGCQAANTMLYVSPNLDVYPCPSFPLLLGNLYLMSLWEVVESTEKRSVRANLAFPPELCRPCGDFGSCRGACRGRSFARHGTVASPDPACG